MTKYGIIINEWSMLYRKKKKKKNVVCLFVRNESVNNQGIKLKNHKFTRSLWLQNWCKLYLAR